MKTTVEPAEGNKVKLSVEVGEDEFELAVEDAFRQLAREVRIPGFRPGRAPRRVLEARLGTGVARDEALRSALPDYYEQAVREHEVDVIAAPEIDITSGEESGAVAFDAVVEVRPEITVSGYQDLRVTIPSPWPTDEELNEQLDTLRRQFSELETVERAAGDGDHAKIDITGTQNGEELDGLTADDYLYEIGAGAVLPELDAELVGARAGDILEFDAAHPEEGEDDLHFRILVKEVQARLLPDLDDEFAAEASEFETVEELRSDIETRLRTIKAGRAQTAVQENTAKALAELVDDEIPEALVQQEMQHRLQDLALRLGAQGITLDQYLASTGASQESLTAELREAAEPAVRVDLALRAVADAESIEAREEAIESEFAEVAERMGQDSAELREEFERGGQLPAVRSDIRKREALEWLVERAEIVDEDGRPVDRADLVVPESDEVPDADPDQAETESGPETAASDPPTSDEDDE